jgi:hypothetical protein
LDIKPRLKEANRNFQEKFIRKYDPDAGGDDYHGADRKALARKVDSIMHDVERKIKVLKSTKVPK